MGWEMSGGMLCSRPDDRLIAGPGSSAVLQSARRTFSSLISVWCGSPVLNLIRLYGARRFSWQPCHVHATYIPFHKPCPKRQDFAESLWMQEWILMFSNSAQNEFIGQNCSSSNPVFRIESFAYFMSWTHSCTHKHPVASLDMVCEEGWDGHFSLWNLLLMRVWLPLWSIFLFFFFFFFLIEQSGGQIDMLSLDDSFNR